MTKVDQRHPAMMLGRIPILRSNAMAYNPVALENGMKSCSDIVQLSSQVFHLSSSLATPSYLTCSVVLVISKVNHRISGARRSRKFLRWRKGPPPELSSVHKPSSHTGMKAIPRCESDRAV